MSFSTYPKYKDSGVEWLGQVPEHWEVSRVSYLFRAGKGKFGQKLTQEFLADNAGDYPVYSGQTQNDGLMGTWNEYEFDFPGQGVLFSTTVGAKAMHIKHLSGKFSLSQNCLIIWPMDARCNIRAFYYHLQPLFIYERGKISEHMQASFRIEDLYSYRIALPPENEQRAIASFLDHETAKIDALVAEQQRLIELLKEKRQAVISHAVTKGLNPNVRMKPSGIEWLGDVPEHWEVFNLKRVFRSVDYGISESLEAEGDIAILRMGNIKDGRIDLSDLKYVTAVEENLLLQDHDLLYNRTNSLDLIGKVGLFHQQADRCVSFASYLVRLRTNDRCSPEYLSFLLNTEGILALARSLAFVAIGQCNLNPTRYGMIPVAVPPLSEQQTIAKHISKLVKETESLTARSNRAITLLQERRTALISAAVTGKIDVRHFAEKGAA